MLNQLVRYEPVLRLVREAGGETVLEVGAGTEGLQRLLDGEMRVTAVDVAFGEAGAREWQVVADSTARRSGALLQNVFQAERDQAADYARIDMGVRRIGDLARVQSIRAAFDAREDRHTWVRAFDKTLAQSGLSERSCAPSLISRLRWCRTSRHRR